MTEIAPQAPRNAALRVIAWVACIIVLLFVAHALVVQFHRLDLSKVHFKLVPTLLAILCVLAVSLMQLVARWTLLIAYGYPLNWRIQLPAAWVPQLGKYVPGGIASVGGAVILLRRFGVPGAVGLSVAVLLDALAVMAGLIVSTPLLLWEPIRTKLPMAWLGCVVLTLTGLTLLHPRVFVALLNWTLRTMHRQPIAQVPPLTQYVAPVIASFAQWVFAGLGLWLMTAAVVDASPRMLPLFIASAALAMTVSYLTPFAPGGIGIREGLYLLTLGPLIGPATAVIVVAMRIIQTLIELLLAAWGVMLLRSIPSDPPAPDQ